MWSCATTSHLIPISSYVFWYPAITNTELSVGLSRTCFPPVVTSTSSLLNTPDLNASEQKVTGAEKAHIAYDTTQEAERDTKTPFTAVSKKHYISVKDFQSCLAGASQRWHWMLRCIVHIHLAKCLHGKQDAVWHLRCCCRGKTSWNCPWQAEQTKTHWLMGTIPLAHAYYSFITSYSQHDPNIDWKWLLPEPFCKAVSFNVPSFVHSFVPLFFP